MRKRVVALVDDLVVHRAVKLGMRMQDYRNRGLDQTDVRYRGADNQVLPGEIRDDGIGFVLPGISRDGMGLGSMRYRARVMRGTLEIQATSPSGTVVICTVPENARAEQAPQTV